jgi:hypothetical protein
MYNCLLLVKSNALSVYKNYTLQRCGDTLIFILF